MHLNGWVRIGLIVSVAWILAGGVWGYNIVINDAHDVMITTSRICNYRPDGMPPRYSPEECTERALAAQREAVHSHWAAAAIVAFVPILFGWLSAWGLVALLRWVRAGFHA